ncbi:MAG: 4a-hydroxytetrahydrobiopterin dehydratase [Chloroflexaceae bacterium]|nr:4a-hydroxytetrahydrobiopterin dehydratase [Chloroflexaceae bacterium]
MAKLTPEEAQSRLEALSGWTLDGDTLRKTFVQSSFPGVIAFVTHVGFLAEAANHHPDLDIRYNKLTVALSTHDAGGLTEKDFDLAAQMDELMI